MTLSTFDCFGSHVSLTSAAAIEAWNQTQLAFLAHGASTPDHLGKTLELDPDFALAYACKGLFCLLLGRREMVDAARAARRDAAEALARKPASPREHTFFNALDSWLKGSPKCAADLLAGLVDNDPTDAMAMKLVQAIRFTLGDAHGMRRCIETTLTALPQDHAAYGYALGCHAFTLEETGEYQLAELTGRKAVLRSPNDAWGLHAVAHVHDMTHQTDAGIQWLSSQTSAWQHCNNFRYHVWWHLALLQLDKGAYEDVFALYDTHIRADRTDDYRDISNAASLLSRLELEGQDVGNRWDELADICEGRTEDGCLAFADLHYLLALIGGERHDAIHALLTRMKRDANEESGEIAAIMKTPGLSAAEGLECFGEGNFSAAFRHLRKGHSAMQTIGGSHAQRDVFDRLTIEAAIRAGCFEDADHLLSKRTQQRAGREDAFASSRQTLIQSFLTNGGVANAVPAE
ncbi:MAG: tetratricopeptide repeat protein [Pseudomonadota bacterium]